MMAPNHIKQDQQGVMLLEALIAILIFSIGILAVVGLQATSVTLSSDAKYRSTAATLANQLLGRMWNDLAVVTASGTTANYTVSQFDSYVGSPATPTATNYASWLATVKNNLPNASATVTRQTTLTPAAASPNSTQLSSTDVTITITWQLPNATSPHSYTTSAHISAQKQT